MVLKEVIFNSFSFGWVVVVLKELIFNRLYLGKECGGLERTDFNRERSGCLESTNF